MRIMRSDFGLLLIGAVILTVLTFGGTEPVAAAPLPSPSAGIDDLPEDGWQLKAYLNGDENSPDKNDWPTLFKFCAGDICVKAECTQPGVPVPKINSEFKRNGEFLENKDGDKQNRFHIIDIYEPPKPKLKSFSLDCDCATPGAQSDEISIRVKAKDEDGGGFKGADVRIFIGDDLVESGKTDSNGKFNRTLEARNRIGSTVRVEVEDLDPKFVDITDELFAPCTGRCDSLTGSYDPASDSISLTVKGAQPGWDAVMRDVTMGGSSNACTGQLDGNGELSCKYQLPQGQFGLFKFDAQVGGSSGQTCQFEVDTPAPVKLVVHKDCTPHGKNSDTLVFSGEMLDQKGQRFIKPLTVTIKLPDKTQKDVTLVNGAFDKITFEDAKKHIGELVEFFWAGGGYASFEIKRSIFDPCKNPEPTQTPTQTPPPGFGRDSNAPPIPLARVHLTPTPWVEAVNTASVFTPNRGKIPFMEFFIVLLVAGAVVWLWPRM